VPSTRSPRTPLRVLGTGVAALALAALALTGCSSDSGSGGSSPSPGSSSSAGSTAAATAIDVTITQGQISPKPSVHRVHLGDHVRLSVTSDQADEAHLHGYDKEIELQPGKPGTIDFTADIPGIFEVELHKSNLQLLQLEVK
jgi:hypothetical protein